MTVAIPPVRTTAPDPPLQQLLMRFTGALNRRRAYAATHPMVVAAEEQLHESLGGLLALRPVLTIGVAKTELLIDGEPYVTRSSYARELATRLHRRGVGAITIQVGVPLPQLRESLAWLAREPAADGDNEVEQPPSLSSITVTPVAYDQLALGDAERTAEHSAGHLWRSLAQIAGSANMADAASDSADADDADDAPERVLAKLRDAVAAPDIAQRTALALLDLTSQAVTAPAGGRLLLGEHLLRAIDALGPAALTQIIRAMGESAAQTRFLIQAADVLPTSALANWLQIAAAASEQTVSQQMLDMLAKLASLAADSADEHTGSVVRSAAQTIVQCWTPDEPTLSEPVAALDRIAMHERTQSGSARPSAAHSTMLESSRLVQMALEIDVAGTDAEAAAETLVSIGVGSDLLRWTDETTTTDTVVRLRRVATTDKAIRQLLLNEPVDRLQARALLEHLDPSAADSLLDVLEKAEARGTRMIVRQRLSEFGAEIAPLLLVRLDNAPWYLVRNILTLLHEIAVAQTGSTAGMESLARLLDHPQVQVRTEAFRLLMLDARAREPAIRRALRDENERIVVLALQALSEPQEARAPISPVLVNQLMEMVDSAKQSDAVRARMVRALALTNGDRVRDWLIGLVVKKSRVLRRTTLVEPTLTAVAATQVLVRVYSGDPVAADVISLARKEGIDRRWQPRDQPGSNEFAS